MIDKETGKEIEIGGNHSLFFIPVKWWPVAFIILGFVFMVAGGDTSNEEAEHLLSPERQETKGDK
ncbi:MAG: hypothetical protein ACI9R3_002583 [Verrucomicrobiales bacterium]